jgi:hypothetical protein
MPLLSTTHANTAAANTQRERCAFINRDALKIQSKKKPLKQQRQKWQRINMATSTTTTISDSPDAAIIASGNTNQNLGEANIASSVARVQAETQAAIIVAQRFRRSEMQCRQDLINAVKASPRLAEKTTYSYPRGKRQDPVTGEWVENIISGPSTYIAREAARTWGNLAAGTEVIRDDDNERQIRSFAWDMQTNVRWYAEASFKKLIQRSSWETKNGKREKVTKWVVPDERDLRELTNKYASIGERNCILKIIPSHMIDEVVDVSRQVSKEEAAKHPEAIRAKLADAFQSEGINVAMLEEYLGHPLKELTPDKIVELRSIYQALHEGNATWDDYRNPTTLPSVEEVPELPKLKELAAQLKWNDARLSNEIGRNRANVPGLITQLTDLVGKMIAAATTGTSSPLPGNPAPQTATSPLPGAEPTQQRSSKRSQQPKEF